MCRNGYGISRRIWWKRMLNHINNLPAPVMNYQWSREQKWYGVQVSIVSILTSRKTEIARSVRGSKLQGLHAEDAMAKPYLVLKILVTRFHQITRSSVTIANLETITDMQSWCRTWHPSGSRRIRAKPRLLRKRKRAYKKSLEPTRKPKVIYTDNSLEFGKAWEDLAWKHCTSTPHRSETNGIAERAVRRLKEGTSAVLLQSGLDESWWADSMECYTYLRNIQDLLFRLARMSNIAYFCQRPFATASVRHESLTRNIPRLCAIRGWNLERRHCGRRHWGFGDDGRIWTPW